MVSVSVVVRRQGHLTIYGYKGIIGPIRRTVLQPEELLKILIVGILFKISGNRNFVTVRGGGFVSDGIVKFSETSNCDLQNQFIRSI